MRRPLIGITGRRRPTADLAHTPESFHHFAGDWFYADYARGVLEAGGLPVEGEGEYLDELVAARGVVPFEDGGDLGKEHRRADLVGEGVHVGESLTALLLRGGLLLGLLLGG